eukprot:TRINITY_DN8090_c0_g1_i1.p1 TRINITY_DN8090_c0_g1~~TRINITY_DN8090_c0_g1_i1.p1  ORF type:complete len:56 (+),score=0.58 TRINITY_DN8090_c0_g1_i1:360-527(+)
MWSESQSTNSLDIVCTLYKNKMTKKSDERRTKKMNETSNTLRICLDRKMNVNVST